MLTLAADIITILLATALVGCWLKMMRARQQLVEYRVALDFIREERSEMPHEFVAIWLAENHQAMEQKFPEFFAYRNACLNSPHPEYAQ